MFNLQRPRQISDGKEFIWGAGMADIIHDVLMSIWRDPSTDATASAFASGMLPSQSSILIIGPPATGDNLVEQQKKTSLHVLGRKHLHDLKLCMCITQAVLMQCLL